MYSTVIFAALLALASAAPRYYEKETASTFEGKKYLPPVVPDVAPKVEKHFYYISAHEEPEQLEHKHLVVGQPKKDYRVIFIKSPTVSTKHKYTIEVAPQHEKTAIYVLAKKNDALNSDDFAITTSAQTSKPEVFFIKYKNEDEVELAKKEIQAEYDKLGGKNEYTKDEYAPITSVVGQIDNQNEDGSYGYHENKSH